MPPTAALPPLPLRTGSDTTVGDPSPSAHTGRNHPEASSDLRAPSEGNDPKQPPLPPQLTEEETRRRLRQIKLERGPCYISSIVIRGFSTALATTCLGLLSGATPLFGGTTARGKLGLVAGEILYVCVILLWDMAEFTTMCFRRGVGIRPLTHICIELLIWLAGVAAVAVPVTLLYLPGNARDWHLSQSNETQRLIFDFVLVGLLMVLTILHFILFVRNCMSQKIRGEDAFTPRIMYLPNGEPVVVVRRLMPPPPTHRAESKLANQQDLEMGTIVTAVRTSSGSVTAKEAAVSPVSHVSATSLQQPIPTLPIAGPSRPSSHTNSFSYDDDNNQDDDGGGRGKKGGSGSGSSSSEIQPPPWLPRRKPVPARGTHYAEPWAAPGPDYIPDEAERRRAERGEAQAQWMSLGTIGGDMNGRHGDGSPVG